MRPLIIIFTVASVLAHPVPEPEPVPTDAVAGLFKRAGVTFSSCTVPNTAALTFDDGPYHYMTDIGNMLNNAGAKGTFFLNGNNWDCIYNYQSQIKQLYAQGHQLASHTWAHLNLVTLSWDEINDQMGRVELALQRIIGAQPAWMRPPYGSMNDQVVAAANAHGQNLALWDFVSGDADGVPPAESKARYDATVAQHPGSVLALHHEPFASTAYEVLPYAIQALQHAGYRLVTVAECVGQNPYQWVADPQTPGPDWHC